MDTKLVELIRGLAISDETFAANSGTCAKLGETAVEVNDYPVFISNRILIPVINEAVYALMEGVAQAEEIETVMKPGMRLGMNHTMGR